MENFQCHRLLYILELKINKLLLLLLLLTVRDPPIPAAGPGSLSVKFI